MRIKFICELPKETIKIPLNYNRHLRDLIYSNLSTLLADFKPERGPAFEKKHFSLFSFSKIFGDFNILTEKNNQKSIVYSSEIHFFVSSPYDLLIREFAARIEPGTMATLGRCVVAIESAEIMPPPVFAKTPRTLIRMLSPISMRAERPDESDNKEYYYPSPENKEFSQLVQRNLLEKYLEFNGRKPKDDAFEIKPHYFSAKKNSHTIKFKDFTIKGYSGIFKIFGSREMKQFAYDCGLGERNAQGFGLFDIRTEKPEKPR
ncbi:MAG: CRISPR-associated endoribonuclease Cas6 [bacterium]|nr:CRISPR-associated endoribonuclease Cas6 [bacterium]